MKKVVILVNKEFEYEGFRRGIASVYANADFARTINLCEDNIDPRLPIYKPPLAKYVFANLDVEVYCIQYLFLRGENSSNSEEKYNNLANLFRSFEMKPDYVMSVSTSESTQDNEVRFGDGETINGCVFIGNQFFLSDQRESDAKTKSHLDIETPFYEDPPLYEHLYDEINDLAREFLDFKKPPYCPARVLKCYAGANFVGIDVVNVMNYEYYEKADGNAYADFQKFFPKDEQTLHMPIGIETTHGVVKMAVENVFSANTPVTFISPITDRYKHFKDDVQGDQNHICSYNGGVATGHILTILDKLIGSSNT